MEGREGEGMIFDKGTADQDLLACEVFGYSDHRAGAGLSTTGFAEPLGWMSHNGPLLHCGGSSEGAGPLTQPFGSTERKRREGIEEGMKD